ncbi:hypothetical protein ACQSET_24260 [Salmonella enterica]|uniref:hypothetical protein n=1 Tax=Salmonella enterica TaxID=28901 RepID=UPI0009B12F66|nr:hypothetical protein [Salmonella enterica]ECI3360031.1 hypothetical protein [Salmonella enterica subsp. diarizonae]WGI47884.1 hypothetical protein QBX66_14835 [Salmonella enterica subsp. diarizonae serovar 48:i:z]
MTTNTNNKLTDEKIKIRIKAIEDRRSASRDFWDGDYEYPEDIELLALLELQELRRNYLALRGEIEDVRSQLYEAENQANEYASELQDRRRADNDEPFGFVTKRCAEHMHDDDRDENNWMWSISAVVIGCNPKLKHEVPVYLHPASSGKEGA